VDVRPAPAGTGLVLVVAIVALAWSRFVRLWGHLLAGRALELVQELWTARRLHCPYLFHGADCESAVAKVSRYGCLGDFKKAWAAACKAAGFPIAAARRRALDDTILGWREQVDRGPRDATTVERLAHRWHPSRRVRSSSGGANMPARLAQHGRASSRPHRSVPPGGLVYATSCGQLGCQLFLFDLTHAGAPAYLPRSTQGGPCCSVHTLGGLTVFIEP